MLKIAPILAIGGVDTEENEHCEVCPLSVYRLPRFFLAIFSLLRSFGDIWNVNVEVMRFSAGIELAEIYDFQLSFDNWTYKLQADPEFEKFQSQVRAQLFSF